MIDAPIRSSMIALITLCSLAIAPLCARDRTALPLQLAQNAEPPSAAEKEAFASAKELGTVDGWNAFLAHYPNGFNADLARAYVNKLVTTPSLSAPANAGVKPSTPTAPRVTAMTVTRVSYEGGEFSQKSPSQWVERRFASGVMLTYTETGRSDIGVELRDASGTVFLTLDVDARFVWRKEGSSPPQRFRDITAFDNTPISTHAEEQRDDRPARAPEQVYKPKPVYTPPPVKSCGKNETLINGKCVWKHDKNGFEIAPWKKPGCGTWLAQCNGGNNGACAKHEANCQVN